VYASWSFLGILSWYNSRNNFLFISYLTSNAFLHAAHATTIGFPPSPRVVVRPVDASFFPCAGLQSGAFARFESLAASTILFIFKKDNKTKCAVLKTACQLVSNVPEVHIPEAGTGGSRARLSSSTYNELFVQKFFQLSATANISLVKGAGALLSATDYSPRDPLFVPYLPCIQQGFIKGYMMEYVPKLKAPNFDLRKLRGQNSRKSVHAIGVIWLADALVMRSSGRTQRKNMFVDDKGDLYPLDLEGHVFDGWPCDKFSITEMRGEMAHCIASPRFLYRTKTKLIDGFSSKKDVLSIKHSICAAVDVMKNITSEICLFTSNSSKCLHVYAKLIDSDPYFRFYPHYQNQNLMCCTTYDKGTSTQKRVCSVCDHLRPAFHRADLSSYACMLHGKNYTKPGMVIAQIMSNLALMLSKELQVLYARHDAVCNVCTLQSFHLWLLMVMLSAFFLQNI